MLDVHPPHDAAHTWRDFFIHIATIVVGLLIAIGLEQTVEYLHRRHQLEQTREALQHELDTNVQAFAADTAFLRHNINALQNDLTVLVFLQQHPHAAPSELPGTLVWPNLYESMSEIAWHTAQSSNALTLMPTDEVLERAQLYDALAALNSAGDDCWQRLTEASRYTLRDPDPTHLSPAQVEEQIRLTEDALLARYRIGVTMANIGITFKEFKASAPDLAAMEQMSIAPLTPGQKQALEPARAKTRARLAATPLPAGLPQ